MYIFIMPNRTHKLSFAQFGDLLQHAWEEGHIGSEVHDFIEAGVVPIQYLREKMRWVIERADEDGYLNITELSDEYPEEHRLAA